MLGLFICPRNKEVSINFTNQRKMCLFFQRPLLFSTTLLLGLGLSSCGQTFNSDTNDAVLSAIGGGEVSDYCEDQSNTRLCEANQIIQENCTSCHLGYHAGYAGRNTDAAWASDVTGANGVRARVDNDTMPQGSSLSTSEKQAILDWIDNM